MKRITALCLIAGLSASAASAQTPCEPYTIQAGDTLRSISNRVGVGTFRELYEDNIAVIGPNVNLIEVGTVLQMPCEVDVPVIVATPDPEPAPEPAPAPATPEPVVAEVIVDDGTGADDPVLRLVTYDGNPPYSGSDLLDGGLATALIERAYELGRPGAEVDLTMEANQLAFTLGLGREIYDIGFPSIRPDCNVIDLLTIELIELCAKYVFSEPFHQIAMEGYALTGSTNAGAATVADLRNARICRPENLFTFDLDAVQLPGPRGALVRTADATACFEALANGDVDIVSVSMTQSRGGIAATGLGDRVSTVPALERTVTLHAVANVTNPTGVDAIARLNSGIAQMRANGDWFRLVTRNYVGG